MTISILLFTNNPSIISTCLGAFSDIWISSSMMCCFVGASFRNDPDFSDSDSDNSGEDDPALCGDLDADEEDLCPGLKREFSDDLDPC